MAGIAIRHNLGWDKNEGVFVVANYHYNAANMAWEKVFRPSGLADGRKVVAVTNTAIVLGSAACVHLWIGALVGNSDVLVVGGSGAVHTLASRTGTPLFQGDVMDMEIDNLSRVYINGVAGDGVSFTYST
jgi:hypothetical protein